MNRVPHDPIMDEVRRVREELAARFDNDPVAIGRYLNDQRCQREQQQGQQAPTQRLQIPPAA